MKIKIAFNDIIAMALLVISCASFVQAEEQPKLYFSVDCMKSTAPDYASVETDIWLPMHQELVNQGKRNSWSLYWVMYGDRSTCDYYTVTTFLGEEQLNTGFPFADAFAAVHDDKDFTKAMAKTWASRQLVSTELWLLADRTEIKKHSYAVVNLMYAEDPDAYQQIESRIFKPGHQALVDGGHRAGWGLYELIAPLGSSIPYNFGTVDFVDHLSPVPMAEAIMMAHPDRDLDAIQELLDVRDHVRSETWALIATTESRSSD